MIGRTNTGGGGGLNFRVIGGTSAPSSPKENTIWVNTATTITGWTFSATQPEKPAAGMVWISTGTSSTAEFNALKKNGIMVYPVSVKQYVGGVWAGKTAMTYQNGSWVEWTTYMYNMGDTCDHLTGGWKTRAWGSMSNNETAKEPKVTYNKTSVTFENSSNTSKLACGVWEPVKDVDLTNVKEVKITILNATSTGNYKKLFFMANRNRNAYYHDDSIAARVDIQGSNSAVTYTLNVENLSGSYDVCVCGGSYNGTTLAEISKIWFVMKE